MKPVIISYNSDNYSTLEEAQADGATTAHEVPEQHLSNVNTYFDIYVSGLKAAAERITGGPDCIKYELLAEGQYLAECEVLEWNAYSIYVDATSEADAIAKVKEQTIVAIGGVQITEWGCQGTGDTRGYVAKRMP